MFGWEWNGGGMEKVSLHKFIYISLLKNSAQLKPKKKKKVTSNQKKKNSMTQIILKNENHV